MDAGRGGTGAAPDGAARIDRDFAARLAAYPRHPAAPPDDPVPAGRALWRWPVALGGGLFGAGIATVFAAGWLVPRGPADSQRDVDPWLSDDSLRVLAVALAAVLALWAVAAWYRVWTWNESSSFRVAGPLLAAVGAVTTGWSVAVDLSTGFLGPRSVTAGVGGFAVLVGSLAALLLGRRRGTVGVRRAVLAAAAGAVTVVLVAAAAVAAPGHGLVATVASPAGTPTVPATVSRVAWSRPIPPQIRHVVPAGPGVLVLVEDGVVAVDGRTGRIRWTYRRPGARTASTKRAGNQSPRRGYRRSWYRDRPQFGTQRQSGWAAVFRPHRPEPSETLPRTGGRGVA